MPSVLNPQPDGMGFLYGFHRAHRIDIRRENMKTRPGTGLALYVDGILVRRGGKLILKEEEFAKHYIDIVLETKPTD